MFSLVKGSERTKLSRLSKLDHFAVICKYGEVSSRKLPKVRSFVQFARQRSSLPGLPSLLRTGYFHVPQRHPLLYHNRNDHAVFPQCNLAISGAGDSGLDTGIPSHIWVVDVSFFLDPLSKANLLSLGGYSRGSRERSDI
jgi:hypothetical protein